VTDDIVSPSLPDAVFAERMRVLRLTGEAFRRIGKMRMSCTALTAIKLVWIDLTTAINDGSEMLPEMEVVS
jgi:hypothetical protein